MAVTGLPLLVRCDPLLHYRCGAGEALEYEHLYQAIRFLDFFEVLKTARGLVADQ